MAEVAYLVKGNDPLLRDRVVDELVAELLGDDDRTLALEDHTVPGRATGDGEEGGGGAEAREAVVAAVLNAASSPPFMTAHRIVVVREAGGLTAADAEVIGRYLDAPLDTSVIVLVSGGGTIPAALTKKLKEVGAGERAPDSEKTSDVLANAARAANVQLRPDAVKLVTAHLGEDAGRVGSFVDVLRSAYGDGATLDADDVAPYLGEAGAVPSYQLTNAIEAGDSAGALEVLDRLLNAPNARDARPMHPLQVLSTLLGYYRRLLRLDDASRATRRRRGRRARRSHQGVPRAQGARCGARARHRRHPSGVRRPAPGRSRSQRRARHPSGRGDRGAGRAIGSPLAGERRQGAPPRRR